MASFSAVSCQTQPLDVLVTMRSVSPRRSGHGCGFVVRPPVPVPSEPPGAEQRLRSGGTLSSSIVVKTQPKPSCDGKFFCRLTSRVREQCGTYVCLLNNTKRDIFYRTIASTF